MVGQSPAPRPARRLVALHRPQSFATSLRASALREHEFRLHCRPLQAADQVEAASCVIGFVLSKRHCKHAVRRNMIRRVFRERLRARLGDIACDPPLVLVLRLAERIPATFVSADSPLLRRHVAAAVDALLQRCIARIGPGAESSCAAS